MRVNVDKVLERDQKLSELDDRADALQAGASVFESSAAKLKNKYWWKNCKVLPVHRNTQQLLQRFSPLWTVVVLVFVLLLHVWNRYLRPELPLSKCTRYSTCEC